MHSVQDSRPLHQIVNLARTPHNHVCPLIAKKKKSTERGYYEKQVPSVSIIHVAISGRPNRVSKLFSRPDKGPCRSLT